MAEHPTIPYQIPQYTDEQARSRAAQMFALFDSRRSVRHFSSKPVPKWMIESAIQTASTAPSGAHRQPWKFVAVSSADVKREIRIAAEKEEHETYEGGRMPNEWREALRPMGTNWQKPYLEIVPWIVVVFEEAYKIGPQGERIKNYYVKESVGLACGMFIAALHNMGLATLTHTPSPMGFLTKILGRPDNERPFILFPIGYPTDDVQVPDIQRRALAEVAEWIS